MSRIAACSWSLRTESPDALADALTRCGMPVGDGSVSMRKLRSMRCAFCSASVGKRYSFTGRVGEPCTQM